MTYDFRRNYGSDLRPKEGADISDTKCCLGSVARHASSGGFNLGAVEAIRVELVVPPHIGGGIKLDGSVATTRGLATVEGSLGGSNGASREGDKSCGCDPDHDDNS